MRSDRRTTPGRPRLLRTAGLALVLPACAGPPPAPPPAARVEASSASSCAGGLQPGLLAWYRGEGTARDGAGSYDGVALRAIYGPGEAGLAFSFDGSTAAVELPNVPAIAGARTTLAAWINSDTNPQVQRWIFGQNGRAQLIVTSGNRAALNFYGADNQFHALADPTLLSLGQWVHYAATLSSSSCATTVTLYRDGQQAATATYPTALAADNGCHAWIGGVNEAAPCAYSGQFFGGAIDDVRVYERTLSAAEVSALYSLDAAGLNRCGGVARTLPSPVTPLAPCAAVDAPDAAPPKPKGPTSEVVEQTIHALFAAWNARDNDKIASLVTDDVALVFYGALFAPERQGKADFTDPDVRGWWGDSHFGVRRTWTKGRFGVVELTLQGTPKPGVWLPGQWGHPVGQRRAAVYVLDDDGRVKEERVYADAAGIVAQARGGKDAPSLEALPTGAPEAHTAKGTADEDRLVDWAKSIEAAWSSDDE